MLNDAEFRDVISILKLLALGAHQVCRPCVSHLSLMMFYFLLIPSFLLPCVIYFYSLLNPLYSILFSLLPARRSLGSTVLATREALPRAERAVVVGFRAQDARASL